MLSRPRVRPFLNIGPICWPINVTPNKKLSIDYYLSSDRRYVGQGGIGRSPCVNRRRLWVHLRGRLRLLKPGP